MNKKGREEFLAAISKVDLMDTKLEMAIFVPDFRISEAS